MRRKRWIVIGAVAVVVLAPFALNAPLPPGRVLRIADQFEPTGYRVTSGPDVEPRRILCLGDVTCPSVSRSWSFGTPVTNDQLTSWLAAAGYDAAVQGQCADAAFGSTITCSAHGTAEGQDTDVYVDADSITRTATVTLLVS